MIIRFNQAYVYIGTRRLIHMALFSMTHNLITKASVTFVCFVVRICFHQNVVLSAICIPEVKYKHPSGIENVHLCSFHYIQTCHISR